MREIKFRGYSEYHKKWLYGSLVDNLFTKRKTNEKCSYIFDTTLNENYDCWEDFVQDEEIEVITKSVGEYTGLKDKNGIEIYENDLLSLDDSSEVYEVVYLGNKFVLCQYDNIVFEHEAYFRERKIIGNKYECNKWKSEQ